MDSISQYGELPSAVIGRSFLTPPLFKIALIPLILLLGGRAHSGEWFNHGRGPVDIKDDRTNGEECGQCHVQIWKDWKQSQHSKAWEDPLFQSGFEEEKKFVRCVYCHDPLGSSKKTIQESRSEGISCAVCHIRNGEIIGFGKTNTHGGKRDPFIQSSEYCGGCHQFNFLVSRSDLIPGHVVSQNTLEEWKAYRAAGGKKTCQRCHMPGGRHLFFGGHDTKRLRQAFRYSVVRNKNGVLFTAWTKGVGHDWPTGDLFRSVKLEVAPSSDGPYKPVAEFSRPLRFKKNSKTGTMSPVIETDTRLKPFERREILVETFSGFYFRWTYHFCSTGEELKGRTEDQSVVLYSGYIRP